MLNYRLPLVPFGMFNIDRTNKNSRSSIETIIKIPSRNCGKTVRHKRALVLLSGKCYETVGAGEFDAYDTTAWEHSLTGCVVGYAFFLRVNVTQARTDSEAIIMVSHRPMLLSSPVRGISSSQIA